MAVTLCKIRTKCLYKVGYANTSYHPQPIAKQVQVQYTSLQCIVEHVPVKDTTSIRRHHGRYDLLTVIFHKNIVIIHQNIMSSS